jgi:DedD protein
MASSQDTEITLGTGKLLALFFGLVVVCAVFFALGYTLGRKSEPTVAAAGSLVPLSSGNTTKPAGAGSASTPMTFYKAVEQQSANPQLTPASSVAGSRSQEQTAEVDTQGPSGKPTEETQNSGLPDPMTAVPGGNYFVQVAAVTKQEDADALVDALKKKTYPAFVAANSGSDKLFRVQVGPFSDVKDAESMRARLISDGYNPILKK